MKKQTLRKTTIFSALFLIVAATFIPQHAAHALATGTSATPQYIGRWGSKGTGDGQFSQNGAVAVSPKTGDVYVLDTQNSRVEQFTGNGTYIRQWGELGSDSGSQYLYYPEGITVDATGNVYVADTGNERIQEFSANGDYIRTIGSNGTGDGQFSGLTNIAFDRNNDLYATDTSLQRIEKFSSTGTYITSWGGPGSGDGQFAHGGFISIAFDTNNVAYVMDSDNYRVETFTADGTYTGQWPTYEAFISEDIAIDNSGHVFISDALSGTIKEYSTDGTYIRQVGTYGSAAGQFGRPTNMAIIANGLLYVIDNYYCYVDIFSLGQNEAQETLPSSSDVGNLSLPDGTNITDESVALASMSDGTYHYPLGLYNFTFMLAPGDIGTSVPVTLTFQTDLNPSQVVARKYNSASHTYQNVANAVITQTTLNGQPALQLSYDVVDGGELDEDGLANGIIVDPVGLATVGTSDDTTTTTPGVPNTGSRDHNSMTFVISLIIGAGLLAILIRKYHGTVTR